MLGNLLERLDPSWRVSVVGPDEAVVRLPDYTLPPESPWSYLYEPFVAHRWRARFPTGEEALAAQGISSTVVDPRWVLPIPARIAGLAADADVVVVLEDNMRAGGVGPAVRTSLEDAGVATPALTFGMPSAFPEHGARSSVLAHAGLSAQEIARRVTERVAAPIPDLSDNVTSAQEPRG